MTRDTQVSILRACARFIAKRLDPLELRLKAVEERGAVIHKGMDGVHGRDGRDGAVGERGVQGEKGLDGLHGKDGAPGNDGRDGVDGAPGPMGERGPAGEKGEAGERGADGAAGSQGEPGPQGAKGLDGSNGLKGKDGQDGIDGKNGADGLHGKDGAPGLNGKDADEEAIVRRVLAAVDGIVQKAVAGIPAPRDGRDGLPGAPGATGEKGVDGFHGKDGRNGVDGRDGLNLEDFDTYLKEDGRTLVVRLVRGDLVKSHEIRFDVPVFRGSYKADEKYEKGDCVNWGGNMWIAKQDAPGRPTDGPGWQLAVRRGADAK